MAERKSWRAWAVVDRTANYGPEVFDELEDARGAKIAWSELYDGKFVIVPIQCVTITVDEKKKRKVRRGH